MYPNVLFCCRTRAHSYVSITVTCIDTNLSVQQHAESYTAAESRKHAAPPGITRLPALAPASTCDKCARTLNDTDMARRTKQAQAKGSAQQANQKKSAGERLCVIAFMEIQIANWACMTREHNVDNLENMYYVDARNKPHVAYIYEKVSKTHAPSFSAGLARKAAPARRLRNKTASCHPSQRTVAQTALAERSCTRF